MCGACVLCVDLLCLPGSWCGEPVKSSFSERVTGYQSESKGCQVSSWFCQKGCFIASTEQTIMNYSSYAWHLLYVPKLHRVIDFNIYLKLLYICNFLAAIQDVFFSPLVQLWLQLLQNFWEIKVPIACLIHVALLHTEVEHLHLHSSLWFLLSSRSCYSYFVQPLQEGWRTAAIVLGLFHIFFTQ